MEIDITDDTTIDNLINTRHLSDPMEVDEFLFIPEENSVYDIPDNGQLIREIAEMFKTDIDAGKWMTVLRLQLLVPEKLRNETNNHNNKSYF